MTPVDRVRLREYVMIEMIKKGGLFEAIQIDHVEKIVKYIETGVVPVAKKEKSR